jgi:hypothetical protein
MDFVLAAYGFGWISRESPKVSEAVSVRESRDGPSNGLFGRSPDSTLLSVFLEPPVRTGPVEISIAPPVSPTFHSVRWVCEVPQAKELSNPEWSNLSTTDL